MSEPRTASDIQAIARAGGAALSDATAARVARAIGPAIQTFATLPPLPLETEPARFVAVQRRARRA